jgi:hypothetical protein
MLIFLGVCILLVSIYVVQKTAALARNQATLAESLQVELKQIKAGQKAPAKSLSYGWFDDGWPYSAPDDDENQRPPLENPTPQRNPDEYMTRMLIAQYQSMPSPHQRKQFLMQLRRESIWMTAEFLDIIYGDENEYVRAWAAGHLDTDFKDYSDWENPVELRNYEPFLLADQASIVRAALWSNPGCKGLPWTFMEIVVNWKEHFKNLTQLERLALMRNPKLSTRYVVALMEADSDDLHITVKEHAIVLSAAAVNPRLVQGSRDTGREIWEFEGDPNSPFEEYGQMWLLCVDKWLEHAPAPLLFFKYIQTTPKVKLTVYERLVEKPNASDYRWLRQEVKCSCDPFIDKSVLKIAWDDPDEECRKVARERVGRFMSYVGVKDSKAARDVQ